MSHTATVDGRNPLHHFETTGNQYVSIFAGEAILIPESLRCGADFAPHGIFVPPVIRTPKTETPPRPR